MPEDTDLEDQEDDQTVNAGNLRRLWEAEQKKTAQLESDNKALAREFAFIKAGLPDTPQVKFFQEHYQGDPTPEAVRTAAAAAGFIDTGATQAETQALANIEAAVTGAEKPPSAGTNDAILEELAKVDGRSQSVFYDIEAVLRRAGHPVESDLR